MQLCRNCKGEITQEQSMEYNGCCCGVCENKVIKGNCAWCGLPLDEGTVGQFCSGGCAQEWSENAKF